METFIKVYIKGEDDLPKKDGEYIVSSGDDKAVEWFFRDNPYDISHWLEDIDWYLKPVEIPEITDEEKFSIREFKVSSQTRIDCAIYQMILDYNGTAMLFSEEYSRKDSVYAQNLKERLGKMLSILNYFKFTFMNDITDKEIQEWALLQLKDDFNPNEPSYDDLIKGAKWYREELKKRMK